MDDLGKHTYHEIQSQPEIWVRTLEGFNTQKKDLTSFWRNQSVEQLIFTGCGSTYYLSLSAAQLFQSLVRVQALAKPASELVLLPDHVYLPGIRNMLVAISRSGETTETIEAVRAFRENSEGTVITITCSSGSTLANQSDFILSADSAQEVSIAQTRSFSSMAVLAEAFSAQLAGIDASRALSSLPSIARGILDRHGSQAKSIGEDGSIERFFFLGSGFLYGIAQEAMLKMKEMSLSNSEAYHPLEFRHGPMSMVNKSACVVGLVSEKIAANELALLRQMSKLGARTIALLDSVEKFDVSGLETIELHSSLSDWARTVIYLPFLQLTAFHRAISHGLDPDHPTNLDAVVKLTPGNL